MFSRAGTLFVLSVIFVGCAAGPKQQPTSLQIQAFQTKEFEVAKPVAFGAVVSVFQDLGYIVDSADKETGFITAGSPSTNKTGFWEAMGGVTSHGQTKATAFVEEIRPGFTTVRLNFLNTKKRSATYGQATQLDTQVLEPEPYRVAFNKIEDAIFIRSAR